MIAVIFEVWPAKGEQTHYLDLAAALRGELETVDGFISVERFQSLTEPGKLLSLSFWGRGGGSRLAQPPGAPQDAGEGTRRRVQRLSPADRGSRARLWYE